MSPVFQIKICTENDLPLLLPFAEDGYFEQAMVEQNDGKRLIFIGLMDDQVAGYAHINYFPQYAPFQRVGIPEIQDLFVAPNWRRKGVGELLILACEVMARQKGSSDIGIGVGIASGFGAAQRLYTRLGYVPDGAGVVFERQPVIEGSMKPVDDRMCIMLVKSL